MSATARPRPRPVPSRAAGLIRQARRHAQQGQLRRAVGLLEDALPDVVANPALRAVTLWELGDVWAAAGAAGLAARSLRAALDAAGAAGFDATHPVGASIAESCFSALCAAGQPEEAHHIAATYLWLIRRRRRSEDMAAVAASYRSVSQPESAVDYLTDQLRADTPLSGNVAVEIVASLLASGRGDDAGAFIRKHIELLTAAGQLDDLLIAASSTGVVDLPEAAGWRGDTVIAMTGSAGSRGPALIRAVSGAPLDAAELLTQVAASMPENLIAALAGVASGALDANAGATAALAATCAVANAAPHGLDQVAADLAHVVVAATSGEAKRLAESAELRALVRVSPEVAVGHSTARVERAAARAGLGSRQDLESTIRDHVVTLIAAGRANEAATAAQALTSDPAGAASFGQLELAALYAGDDDRGVARRRELVDLLTASGDFAAAAKLAA